MMKAFKTILMFLGWLCLLAICAPLAIAFLVYFIWKAIDD